MITSRFNENNLLAGVFKLPGDNLRFAGKPAPLSAGNDNHRTGSLLGRGRFEQAHQRVCLITAIAHEYARTRHVLAHKIRDSLAVELDSDRRRIKFTREGNGPEHDDSDARLMPVRESYRLLEAQPAHLSAAEDEVYVVLLLQFRV